MVLDSCSSGIGQLQKAEGMIALPRSLLYAGATNMAYTLFDINDNQAGESLISLFLAKSIAGGLPYAKALRQAKLAVLAQPDASLSDWASFILLGV